eukprot:jgi/Botrbrau1/16797/Bobra.150_2s0026.1
MARNQLRFAFKTGTYSRKLVLIGGLTDGFFFAPYWTMLNYHLKQNGWAMVQPLLSSSHTGWGISSLEQDASEIRLLLEYLLADGETKEVVLMGHSTGCQDVIRLCRRLLEGGMETVPLVSALAEAEKMIREGRGDDILLRYHAFDGAPVTATRFHSLVARKGDDDMFSSDFGDWELTALLGWARKWPCLVVVSGSEEYVPPHVDVANLGKRLAAGLGPDTRLLVVEGAPHNLEGHEEEATLGILDFVNSLNS